jgi:hypothetical protein
MDCSMVGSCGDGFCNTRGGEDAMTCPADCGTTTMGCGDGTCADTESLMTCPLDCAVCGDGVCTRPPEGRRSCPMDCG